uniref:Uncharacterized protein n=1 Tax=Pipistrellus kuhlii TaxID=59472 RepID=A0A7J7W354_PIPKU|nr:hypothetical protein mPipKuh1_008197 [Pipistrellus kuhlii]
MFSCCLPVSRGQGRGRSLKRGSEDSTFRYARLRIRTQSRRRLWPFARRDRESSTRVKEEQQVVEENPRTMSCIEEPVSHTTEGQERPEVSVATWGSGDPGPVDGQPGTPPPKPPRRFRPPTPKQPRFNRQLKVFTSDLDYSSHVNQTGPEHLESKEAEISGEKLGK